MSTTGARDVLAEDAAVEGEEAIISISYTVQQWKQFADGFWPQWHGSNSVTVRRLVVPGLILEQFACTLPDVLTSHLKQLTETHAREQQKLDAQSDPSGQVGQRGPDDRGIDGTDAR